MCKMLGSTTQLQPRPPGGKDAHKHTNKQTNKTDLLTGVL